MLGRATYGVVTPLSKAALVAMLLCGTAQAETLELVALGDSLTQGYGLPEADGFVPQLEAWLRADGLDVDVINAGVSGDTTAGGLARVDWSLQDTTDAMMVALGGNDLLRGIDPAVSRENLDGILTAADGRDLPVLLVGLSAPGNYGAAYKRDFEAMYPDLAEQYGARFVPDFLGPLTEEGDPSGAMAFMQSDGIHPNAEGVARIVEAIGPEVAALLREDVGADDSAAGRPADGG
ncbi:arylesterase [Roseivivax marinus]|uniref:arylesterase n=1 Tax=Roseivivax marinus TaxID=1379903 RepID=UPI000685FE8F|nr:arylesterase [Roseivivax marinus]UMA65164.1 arylesterase [Roseivivax marinus]SEK55490.1 acyl-CoA thioesterase-1 [Roseivivax marinus]